MNDQDIHRPVIPNARLRAAREQKGWTQRSLAQMVQVEEQTVRSWERGKRFPSLESRMRLSALFGLSAQELGLTSAAAPVSPSSQEASPPMHSLSVPPSTSPFAEKSNAEPDGTSAALPSPVASRRAMINRQRMLTRVRQTWIEGVLRESLHDIPLLVPELLEQPAALPNPWQQQVQETVLPPRPLPARTTLLELYDQADGKLLLLGEPGAGKTTLLLELAQLLLDRAHGETTHPIPVVFNLSSWAHTRPSLDTWLVEELSAKYHVPRLLGAEWIETEHVLLLLDGLDEVAEPARAACIKAINAYQRAHDLVPIVLCCRKADYFALPVQIQLERAVLIQPLTSRQVERYLARAGAPLEAVRSAFQHDQELRALVTTPLMLTVVMQAYRGAPADSLVKAGSLEGRREQVLATYIQQVLARRHASTRWI